MSLCSLAHNATTATLFAGYLASLERTPAQWRWPASTGDYLRYRIDTIALELVQTGATEGLVA